jgi:hypothetical protein
MEDYQKEFLHIKALINQKAKVLLNNQDYFTFNINEEFRSKVKRFWGESTVEQQVAMFLDNQGRASQMVTSAMQSFGELYIAAKKNPSAFSQIDNAITEKTYFSKEVLPGFEGRLAMTQLFCNGRNSNGAYRMHNFFYLLPTGEFENESKETDNIRISEVYKGVESFSGSKDAMYCINLLKEVYGNIKLRYFKMGVFLGDYLPDNLWSVWRYMNCREFTFGVTTIIPVPMYSVFIEAADQYFNRFLSKLQPCILTQLWRTNIAIAIFATLFENSMLLAFFNKNPKVAKRYGFTGSCLASQPPLVRSSIGTLSGSQNSESDSGSDKVAPHQVRSPMIIKGNAEKGNQGKSKSFYADSNDSGSNCSLSSSSLSNSHHSFSHTRSSRGIGELSLKKPPQFKQSSKALMKDPREALPQMTPCPAPFYPPTYPFGTFDWKMGLPFAQNMYDHCLINSQNLKEYLATAARGSALQPAMEPQLTITFDPSSSIPSKQPSDYAGLRYLQRETRINCSKADFLTCLPEADLKVGETLLKLKFKQHQMIEESSTKRLCPSLRQYLASKTGFSAAFASGDPAVQSNFDSQDSLLCDLHSDKQSKPSMMIEPTRLRSEYDFDMLFGNLIRLQRVRIVPRKLTLPASFNSLKLDPDGVPPRFRQIPTQAPY